MHRNILSLASFALSACATVDRAATRDERPVTIGWLGVHYRPNADHAVIIEGDNSDGGGVSFTTGYRQRRLDALDGKRHTQYKAGAHFVYYPEKTSNFFWGGGLAFRRGSGDFRLVPGDATSARGSYDVDALYLSLPVGWTGIVDNKTHATWLNGLTVNFDIGPRIRLQQKIHGGDDDAATTIEQHNAVLFGSGILIGYSF